MTRRRRSTDLRSISPVRVLDGYGRSVKRASRCVEPRSIDELKAIVSQARKEGLKICFRGSGRSYGDAALADDNALVLDMTAIRDVLQWDPSAGLIDAECGLTIEGLWRRTIEDGWWPSVVPGTMHPTLAGCVSMNVHGKNNYRVGPIGDHVIDFDLLTSDGSVMRCSRNDNEDVFHAAIGGLGLLGAITRVRMQMKRVYSGRMRVHVLCSRNLKHTFELFEQCMDQHNYLVGWVDCTATGNRIGRTVLHAADYLRPGEDPLGPSTLHVENQGLPSTILGVPKSMIWRFMQPFMNNFGVTMTNRLKYIADCQSQRKPYYQSHVAFAFLLDYVPNWRLAYGQGGFLQYQVFVPYKNGCECMQEVIKTCQEHKLPPYLGVFKRHKPDSFLLSHALDGWSLAMDFPVTTANQTRLRELTDTLTQCVVQAGGKFYFAKDSVLNADDIAHAYGTEVIANFAAIKHRLDPNNIFESALSRRLLPDLSQSACVS